MSMQTETRHTEIRKPGLKQEQEVTTVTQVDNTKAGNKSYAEVAAAGAGKKHASSSRRSSFSQQAQQLIPGVSKQQLAYGLPVIAAILLSLALLWFRSSSFMAPPPPPTLTQQFAHKMDSFAHTVGGDYWESLKSRTSSLSASVSELTESFGSHPGVEKLKQKADDLKAEADRQYQKANELAAEAKAAGAKQAHKAGAKVDSLKEKGGDAYDRANLHGAGIAETVKHAVNEAAEAVRHAAAETSESLRHRAANVQNAASHKVQDVKETVHNIKQTIKEKL